MISIRVGSWCLGCIILFLFHSSQALGARILSITMCEEFTEGDQAKGVKTRFNPDTPKIHLLVQYDQHKPGTRLKCVWVSVDAIEAPNYEIDSIEVALPGEKSSIAHFSPSRPTNGWPPGAYKCDLYFDGILNMSVPFHIAASPTSGPVGPQSTPPQASSPKLTSIVACEQVTGQGTIPVSITETFTPDSPEIHALARLENVRAEQI